MDVAEFSRLQARSLRELEKKIRALFHELGVPVTEAQVAEMAQRLYPPTHRARNAVYAATLAYLATQPLPAGVSIPLPRPYSREALTATLKRITTDIRFVGEPVTARNRADLRVIRDVNEAVQGVVLAQAKEPARETVAALADEHERIGWARVLKGAYSCSWCAMLASRGPVYSSKEAAVGIEGQPLTKYHRPRIDKWGNKVGGFCDCEAVPVVKGVPWEGAAARKRLKKLWDNTEKSDKPDNTKMKAFRREWEKRVRAGETEKFLPDSINPAATAA